MSRPRKPIEALIESGTYRKDRHGARDDMDGSPKLQVGPCQFCGSPIGRTSVSKLRNCTRLECKRLRRKVYDKPCLKCGDIVHTKSIGRKYCDGCSVTETNCVTCGIELKSRISRPKKYCSVKCGARAKRMIKNLLWNTFSRLQKLGFEPEEIEVVEPFEVFNRDGWKCGLCGFEIDRRLKSPNPRAPSVYHEVPLSKGGEHTFDNCKLACLSCSKTRSRRMAKVA